MADLKISKAVTTDLNNIDQTTETTSDFRRTVPTADQDLPGYSYTCDWSKWFGYFKKVPELQAVVLKKALWTVGKGYETDERTKRLLERIKGFGKDTFNEIMKNMVIQYTVGGDGFAEIVRKNGKLINLKPLNPGTMSIVTNKKGFLEGYEQNVWINENKYTTRFKPEEIFHLPWQRVGSEPHGRSTIEKLEDVIESKEEAMKDIRIVFHRYVKPLIVSIVDTDDEAEIDAYKLKLEKAIQKMENIVIPKTTVDKFERVSIPQFSTLDPLPWIEFLRQMFILAEGVPEVILGIGKEVTEASSKILYLAFQQNIEDNQRFLEDNIRTQLDLDVQFNFPATIEPGVKEDVRKERSLNNMEMGLDMGDMKEVDMNG